MKPRVLPIRSLHLDGVMEIAVDSFDVPWERKDFAYFLDSHDGLCLGAFEQEKLIGYLIGLLAGGDLDVVSVATHQTRRRRGIAELMLRTAARVRGVNRLFLEVAESNNAAIACYHKVGFRTIGRRSKYYQGREDALNLRWVPVPGKSED